MKKHVISAGDRAGLIILMLGGIAIAGTSVVFAILRIIDVLPNRDVEVNAVFEGTTGQAPIGPGGSAVDVELTEAVLTVDSLPTASLWSIVLQQVIVALCIIAVVTCLLLLAWAVLRDNVFSKRNTLLVSIAGISALVGLFSHSFFGNMAANGAFARLSDRDFDNPVMGIDLSTVFLTAFVFALVATVFTIGERLQRDTEGLV